MNCFLGLCYSVWKVCRRCKLILKLFCSPKSTPYLDIAIRKTDKSQLGNILPLKTEMVIKYKACLSNSHNQARLRRRSNASSILNRSWGENKCYDKSNIQRKMLLMGKLALLDTRTFLCSSPQQFIKCPVF